MSARLEVKNWRVFQHYKDRSPPWIKLQKSLLDDFDFQMLPIASKALAPMLWLLASEHEDGSIDADPRRLSFRLRWPEADIIAGLKPLIFGGFLIVSSGVLAPCLQDATPETETETETEGEKEIVGSLRSPTVALLPLAEKPENKIEDEKPPAKPRSAYTKDFEFLWSEWPQNPNESKKTAFERWRRLSDNDKADCLDGAMAQCAWLQAETTKRNGRDPPRIHLATFISERRWETLLKTEFNRYGRNPWQTPQHH
jgi:hypothetical protein